MEWSYVRSRIDRISIGCDRPFDDLVSRGRANENEARNDCGGGSGFRGGGRRCNWSCQS